MHRLPGGAGDPVDDGTRRADGSQQAEPQAGVEIGHSGLGHRRDVGQAAKPIA
jgi:hypothetical protein